MDRKDKNRIFSQRPARWIARHIFSSASHLLHSFLISRHHQNEEPVFSKDCKVLLTTVPLKQGDQGTFNHITVISNRVKLKLNLVRLILFTTAPRLSRFPKRWKKLRLHFDVIQVHITILPRCAFHFSSSKSEGRGSGVRHLTSGSWEVTQVLAYDEEARSVWECSTNVQHTHAHNFCQTTILSFTFQLLLEHRAGIHTATFVQVLLHTVHTSLYIFEMSLYSDTFKKKKHLMRALNLSSDILAFISCVSISSF